MGSAHFPTFPGWGYVVSKKPRAGQTAITPSASGKEVRIQRYSQPLWRITLTFNFLGRRQRYNAIGQVPVVAALTSATGLIADDFAALEGFFLARHGSWDSWLFEDPRDEAIAQVQFGVGDNVSSTFQIVRTLGEFAENIQNINGTPVAASTWGPTLGVAGGALVLPTPTAMLFQQDPILAGWQSAGWPMYYQANAAGTTGAVEPRWRQLAPLPGMTIQDGGVTWTCIAAPVAIYQEETLPDFATNHVYAINDSIQPLTGNSGGFTYICTTPGTSPGSAPATWTQQLGAAVSLSSGVVFTCYGVSAMGVNNPIVLQLPASYSLSPLGQITFNTVPDAGDQLFATASFYFRCRFEQDEQDFELFMSNFAATKQLSFISIKL